MKLLLASNFSVPVGMSIDLSVNAPRSTNKNFIVPTQSEGVCTWLDIYSAHAQSSPFVVTPCFPVSQSR